MLKPSFFLEEPFPKHSDFLQELSFVLMLKQECIQRKSAILFGLNVVDKMWPENEDKQVILCMRKEEEMGKKEEKRLKKNSKALTTIILRTGLTFSIHQFCQLNNCRVLCRSQPGVAGRRAVLSVALKMGKGLWKKLFNISPCWTDAINGYISERS